MPTREQNSNKGTFGKVLNFCGSDNYIGAAYLSAISSLKVGAGFSALASTKEVISSVSTMLPEAVYLSRKEGLNKIEQFPVVLIGCGLGQDFKAKNLFHNVMKNILKTSSLVIDADGLNILAKKHIELNTNTILTPHPLEASRLLGCELNWVLNNLEESSKLITKKYKCITVLKTHRTIICDPDMKIFKNRCGNSALAKAGSGDVLAGIISGLLAQKLPPIEASKIGVYLHARAGEIASEELTEYSVLASDLPNYIHKAIAEIV